MNRCRGFGALIASASIASMLLIAMALMAGCLTTDRELAPEGVYAGDKVLYDLDEFIIEMDTTFDSLLALEERHPSYVKSSESLSAFMEDVRSNYVQWMNDLIAARDVYVVTKDMSALQSRVALLQEVKRRAVAYLVAKALEGGSES